jgi:hypothetical protein
VYSVDADLGVIALITQISNAAGIDVDSRAEESEQVAQLWGIESAQPAVPGDLRQFS